MNTNISRLGLLIVVILFLDLTSRKAYGQTNEVINLGTQRELFIDDHLISEMKNV